MSPTTRVPIIFGAAVFGGSSSDKTHIHTVPDAQAIVDIVRAHGHQEFDTSSAYGNGSSEELLGHLDLKGGVVDTKVGRTAPGDHAPEKLRATVHKSVKALGAHNKINILYLHAPDRSVPYEDTLREINELHKQGLFKEFGLSNFNSWEVAEIYAAAKFNGWVVPTVYQGVYNAVERGVELELLPCLRKYGIRFYGYSPLAMGVLSGSVLKEEDMHRDDGGRWSDSFPLAELLRAIYRPLLPTVRELDAALKSHNISFPAAALRWLQHHSALTPSDGIVCGGKNPAQVEGTLTDSEGGPLPQEVVELLETAWKKAKPDARHYAF